MKDCEHCKGTGLVQIAPPDPQKVTRSLWKWALCQCIKDQLAYLRGVVKGLRLALDAERDR